MTRYASWPSWAARAVLVAIVMLTVLGGQMRPSPPGYAFRIPMANDTMMYVAIANRVRHGESYYHAAGVEQRSRWYATAPAQVFREPTLAWVLGALQKDWARRIAIVGMALATLLATWFAVRERFTSASRMFALPVIGTATLFAWLPGAAYVHEIWAGYLIALSLATYRADRWLPGIVLAVLACLIRELALPYMFVMLFFAWHERRITEALAWASGIALFAGLYALHLWIASGLHHPGDPTSGSWIWFGGWPFVIATAKRNVTLILLPDWLVAFILCVSLAGFAGSRDRWIRRAGLTVAAFVVAFLIVGRPGDAYWGWLYAPLMVIGAALAPAALFDLVMKSRWTGYHHQPVPGS